MEKASLLAFVTWLRPQSTDDKNPLANSYYKKYAECVNKIKVSFSNDNELHQFIGHFDADNKKIKKQKIFNLTIKNYFFWAGVVVLAILIFILKPTPTYKSIEKSSMAVENALKEGNTSKAINIFLEFEGSGKHKGKWQLAENGTAQSIIDACLTDENLKDAIRVGNAAGMKYGDVYDYNEKMASTIYEYCISHGDFETAKSIYHTANCEFDFHGKYIKDVVTYLCEHGKKDEAQKFLNNNIDIITSYDDLYKSGNGDPVPYVKRIIQGIIDQY